MVVKIFDVDRAVRRTGEVRMHVRRAMRRQRGAARAHRPSASGEGIEKREDDQRDEPDAERRVAIARAGRRRHRQRSLPRLGKRCIAACLIMPASA